MADTPTGETVTPGDSQTTVQTPAPPQGNAVDPAEVERLRKEKEQADLRIRQLENEKKAREEKEEAERQKQLEEQNEWKQIAEQNKAKADALEAEKTEAEKKALLDAATNGILGDYSQEVREIATETGLSLTDDSDEAKEAYKAKLDKISEKVVASGTVTPNNPGNATPKAPERQELIAEAAKTGQSLPDAAIESIGWVSAHKRADEEGVSQD